MGVGGFLEKEDSPAEASLGGLSTQEIAAVEEDVGGPGVAVSQWEPGLYGYIPDTDRSLSALTGGAGEALVDQAKLSRAARSGEIILEYLANSVSPENQKLLDRSRQDHKLFPLE